MSASSATRATTQAVTLIVRVRNRECGRCDQFVPASSPAFARKPIIVFEIGHDCFFWNIDLSMFLTKLAGKIAGSRAASITSADQPESSGAKNRVFAVTTPSWLAAFSND